MAPELAGTGRNKRPKVLGDHPRHFLAPPGRPERLGTVWNGLDRHAIAQRRVSGQPAGGEIEIRTRGRLEKIEIEIFENLEKS